MEILDGARVSNVDGVLGFYADARGTVHASGAGTFWTNNGRLVVGYDGTGILTIDGGATVWVDHDNGYIGARRGSSGEVTVSGTGSSLAVNTLEVGFYGVGSLHILDGGYVLSRTGAYVGHQSPEFDGGSGVASGTVTVEGPGSIWEAYGRIYVGYYVDGTLITKDGGVIKSSALTIGGVWDSVSSSATLTGANSLWSMPGYFSVGGRGQVTVADGARVENSYGSVGGSLTVTGSGTSWVNSSGMAIGSGSLLIADGATVQSQWGDVGLLSDGLSQVTISGAGSTWTISGGGSVWPAGQLRGGYEGRGALTVEKGGTLNTEVAIVGYLDGYPSVGTSDFLVTGAGSVWNNAGALTVGSQATGSLTVADAGTVRVSNGSGSISVASVAGYSGAINIGAASTLASDAVGAGSLEAASIAFGDGTGSLNFNHTDTNHIFSQDIVSSGTGDHHINSYAGTTRLTGDGSAFKGVTTVVGGRLIVANTLGGTASVTGGRLEVDGSLNGNVTATGAGTVAGNGTIAGDLTFFGGGILSGSQGQTLHVAGNLSLGIDSAINVSLGAVPNAALFDVGGNLRLAGTLNVSDAGSFGPGLYRIFSYGGALTDNGLVIGTVPGGDAGLYNIQTAVAGQVNLFTTYGTPASFWDGGNVALHDNGAVDGGSGAWRADGRNWTTADGSINGPYTPNPSFSVFTGADGTVAVDNSAGAIMATGMQFATGGYRLEGDALTLSAVNGESIIRVGDGTAASAQMGAEIAAELTGNSRLVKTDGGTLILSADNLYTGGTTITGGALQIGNGGTSGSIVGDVTNNGVLAFNRSDAYTFAGAITGSGGVSQIGSGTLIFSGANSYTGGTELRGGTLQVSDDGNLGDVAGALTFNGGRLATIARFDIARNITLAQTGEIDVAAGTTLGLTGVVSGAGDLVKTGAGTLRLDNAGNGYGNTLVQSGLLIGNAASISGTIGNAGTVVFDQASDGTFAGNIGSLNSTFGHMVKTGAGNLTLTGTSTLDWSIAVGGVSTAAERFGGNAAIVSGAALTFDQSANAAYGGVLTGTGRFVKAGAGALVYDGNSASFAGATDVTAGALIVGSDAAHAGALLGGSLNVQNGGTLAGHGTVGSGTGSVVTVANGATLSPGNSIGMLTVNGNLVFEKGSIFAVELNPTDSNRVDVTGQAQLQGGIVTVAKAGGVYLPGSHWTILNAQSGITGQFDALEEDMPYVGLQLDYDASNVYLDIKRNDTSFCLDGFTRNQCATANGVESLGTGNSLYDLVASQTSASAAAYAFDQLSGEIHASAKTALIEDSRFVRNAVNDRIRAAFDGVGASGSVTTYVDGKPVSVAANSDRFAVWGESFGSWGHSDGDGNAARLNRSTSGFFIGADAPVFDTWRFGAVAGYSNSDFNVKDRRSSGSSDNYHVGLYGGATWGNLALRTGAAYSWHDISTSRSVAFRGFADSLKGGYQAATTQAFGELAYDVNAGGARFEPFANLAYVSLHTDGFTEKGGAAALTSASANTDATFTTLGLRGSTTFNLGGANLTAKGMLGWRHAFGDVTPLSTMRFASGGNAFTIAGVPIARSTAVIEAGLDYALSPKAILGVSYGGQFGSGLSDQSGRASFNVKF
ncbi:autotransporter domain-containing protein [Bradyrhizobium sp. USDA 4501]